MRFTEINHNNLELQSHAGEMKFVEEKEMSLNPTLLPESEGASCKQVLLTCLSKSIFRRIRKSEFIKIIKTLITTILNLYLPVIILSTWLAG